MTQNTQVRALGGTTPQNPPNIEALRAYNVNRAGKVEVIWQPTYEYQDYLVAGHTQLTFFQNTVGSVAGGLSVTNVRAAGQFPRPQEFLITGIQVTFEVGAVVAQAAAAVASNLQDSFDVLNSGNLELFIGSKAYLNDAPVGVFPQQYGIATAVQTGATTAADYARPAGRYYQITPVKIPANQNFAVTLNWPEGAVPVVTQATIGVRLDGFLYRLSQ